MDKGNPNVSDIWERQRLFNERVFKDRGLDIGTLSLSDKIRWTKEFVLHTEGELHELLGETNWKMHRVGGEDGVVRSNVREEWIDCFKFLLGIANVWGFEIDELVEEFRRKSTVVEYRYKMERRLSAISPTDPVVAVDIDGVLNDYPAEFCEWLVRTAPEFKGRGNVPFLSVARAELGSKRYLELKDVYRESGEKREQRVRSGAKDLLDGLRAHGFTVVLLSRRPYWKFYRIYADTLEWLDHNGLNCDAVLFHREKHRKIIDSFPGLVAMIEDDPKVADEVRAAGYPVILVRSEINAGIEDENIVESPDLALVKIPLRSRRF